MSEKKVFISYSQDSESHSAQALELANRFEAAGICCSIDQKVGPEEVKTGLPVWMSQEIIGADYLIVVCSERYQKLLTGIEKIESDSLGAWESVFSVNEVYNSVVHSKKMVPVIFNDYFRSFIPDPLQDRRVFLLDDEVDALIEGIKQGDDFSYSNDFPVISVPEIDEPEVDASQEETKAAAPQQSMAELMASQSIETIRAKTVIDATVLEVGTMEVLVDVGAKAEGIISTSEFNNVGELEIGQTVKVYVEKSEGADARPVLSHDKARQIEAWKKLSTDCKPGTVITGRVKSAVKGGLIVNVGIDSFLPASQVDVVFSTNLDHYVGQTFDFKIVDIDLNSRHVVVSRRALLEEQRRELRREFFATKKEGAFANGCVRSITDFGAFVDLGGVDGLIPISELSWARVDHPNEVVAIGEEVMVKVIELNEERDRVALSLKQAQENPWSDISKRYPDGKQVKGKVVSFMPFGAFVELEAGVQGLIHLSEFSWTKRVEKPEDVLKKGEEIAAIVLNADPETQKMSLSLRHLEMNPWVAVSQNYTAGSRTTGTVTRLATFGAFVELDEGIEGLVHISDMSWTKRPKHPSDIVKVGQELDVMVLSIDAEEQRIGLGIKQADEDPWEAIDSLYHLGDVVDGKVSRITSFGAFVDLGNHIEGLVHISEISEKRVNRIEDVLSEGEAVKARILSLDKAERRIGLSIKSALLEDDSEQIDLSSLKKNTSSATSGGLNNLGALLDAATFQNKKG